MTGSSARVTVFCRVLGVVAQPPSEAVKLPSEGDAPVPLQRVHDERRRRELGPTLLPLDAVRRQRQHATQQRLGQETPPIALSVHSLE